MGGLGARKERERERERETKKKLWVQGLFCVHSKGVLASGSFAPRMHQECDKAVIKTRLEAVLFACALVGYNESNRKKSPSKLYPEFITHRDVRVVLFCIAPPKLEGSRQHNAFVLTLSIAVDGEDGGQAT